MNNGYAYCTQILNHPTEDQVHSSSFSQDSGARTVVQMNQPVGKEFKSNDKKD